MVLVLCRTRAPEILWAELPRIAAIGGVITWVLRTRPTALWRVALGVAVGAVYAYHLRPLSLLAPLAAIAFGQLGSLLFVSFRGPSVLLGLSLAQLVLFFSLSNYYYKIARGADEGWNGWWYWLGDDFFLPFFLYSAQLGMAALAVLVCNAATAIWSKLQGPRYPEVPEAS